jgi:tetratricopeptide (TPR) repeat protein
MPNSRLKYFFILLGVTGLLVLLLLMPKQPASVREQSSGMTQDADSLKLIQAVELVNGDNPMQGITMLREIIAEDSLNLTAQFYLGLFSVKSGQVEKAIGRFKTVIAIDSTFAQAYAELGGVYLQMDSLDAAMKQFETCLVFEPDNLDALFFTARIYEQQENWEKALTNYRRVLELNTDTVVDQRIQEFVDIIEKKIKP